MAGSKLRLFMMSVLPATYALLQDGCGSNRGCWFQPANCESVSNGTGQNMPAACEVYQSWTANVSGISFQMMARVANISLPENGRFIALAFSLDKRMGDDSVIQCVVKPNGDSAVYVGFNDGAENFVLFGASRQLLNQTSVTYINGILSCSGFWNFASWSNLAASDHTIFELNSKNASYHLLSARGGANPRTMDLLAHDITDGILFPFISSSPISFYPDSPNVVSWIHIMEQSAVPRRTKHVFAIVHGVLMLSGWWVFGATGILIARYGKLGNSAAWFQLHRLCVIILFFLQTVAFVLIYVQARTIFSVCTIDCDIKSLSKIFHSILGSLVYGLTVMQLISGMLRPGKESSVRPFFNIIHRGNGFLCWIGATICCLLAIQLGKTGLYYVFKLVPYYVMIGAVVSFIISLILLELVYKRNTEECDSSDQSVWPFVLIVAINALIALGATTACTYMMVTAYHAYGFD